MIIEAQPDSAELPGPALLAREARVSYGPVPDRLDDVLVPADTHVLKGDRFLLRTGSGYGFFYTRGEGVTVERAAHAVPGEQELWLNGSVYAAIASINGYLPFHASAVAWRGRVHAFSGPSGAGKSTLAAALGRHGLPLFCDDTLVLDIADPARVLCLPGHKRLKLTPEALTLTGAQAQERVAPIIDKHYAKPSGGILREVLPLASLTFLEDGEPIEFRQVSGAERVAFINDDHYTADLFAAARAEPIADRFSRISRIAAVIPMQRLIRPRDAAQFDATIAQVAARILGSD